MGCAGSKGSDAVSPKEGGTAAAVPTASVPISEAAVSRRQNNNSGSGAILKLDEDDVRSPVKSRLVSDDGGDITPGRRGKDASKYETQSTKEETAVTYMAAQELDVDEEVEVMRPPAGGRAPSEQWKQPAAVDRNPSDQWKKQAAVPPGRMSNDERKQPREEGGGDRDGQQEPASKRRTSQVVDQAKSGFFDFSALPTRPADGERAEPITLQDALPTFAEVVHAPKAPPMVQQQHQQEQQQQPQAAEEPGEVDPWASLQSQYKVKNQQSMQRNGNGGGRDDMSGSIGGPGGGRNTGRRAAPPAALPSVMVLDDIGMGGLRKVHEQEPVGKKRGARTSQNGGGWDTGNMAKAGTIMVDDDDLDLDHYGSTHALANAPSRNDRIEERAPPPQKYNNQGQNNTAEMGLEDVDDELFMDDVGPHKSMSPALAAKLAAFDAMNADD